MHDRHDSRPAIRRMIATTLAIAALGCSAGALAQTTKEAELEARIAELEKLVKELSAKQAAAAPAAPAAAAPAKPAAAPIQTASITPNAAPSTSFLITGFVKADGLFTDTEYGDVPSGAGRDFYVPGSTPVPGVSGVSPESSDAESVDFNAHAKQTRINFGTDTILEGGDKLMTRFEIDFYGSAGGNERVNNSNGPVMRHAYVQWRNWLVGQTWSNFMDVATLPEAVDFIGTTDGTTFVRQPQVRYTIGGFSLSAENPETSITPFGGGAQITADDSRLPDITARYAFKGDWGHIALAGLLRELSYETATIDDTSWTGALSLSGKFNVFSKDDIRWMLLGGNLGRYVGLNFANDAVLDSGGDLEGIDGYAGFIAYRHVWTPKLRSTFSYAMQDYDNDSDLTGLTANKSSDSWTINLFYSPLPKLDIGAEYRRANREVENGDNGDLDRLQLTTKYSF
jgi:hypothetical protein